MRADFEQQPSRSLRPYQTVPTAQAFLDFRDYCLADVKSSALHLLFARRKRASRGYRRHVRRSKAGAR